MDQKPPRWPSVNYSAFSLVCRVQFPGPVQACLSDEQTRMSSKRPDTSCVPLRGHTFKEASPSTLKSNADSHICDQQENMSSVT